jgi:hypothetical protein
MEDRTAIRTGIYVFQTCNVMIKPTLEADLRVTVARYNQLGGQPALGIRTLERGIYQIVSNGPMAVQGSNLQVVVASGKDQWPDPKIAVGTLEPGATEESVQAFFGVISDV